MPNKVFYGAFGSVIAALSIGILVLALLVAMGGPRVRHVMVQNQDGGGEIASTNQGLTLVFDRPIEGTDLKTAIEVQPKTDFSVSHRNQQLSVTFDQNLLSDTDYVLTVSPELEDSLGKQMEHEYSYEFAAAEPSFTYLERNYGHLERDKIIEKAPLSQQSYILFWADRISRFARNDRYVAVVLPRADKTDELHVVDLETFEERSIDIPSNARIDNQFVFIARVRPESGDDAPVVREGESYLKGYGSNKLYRYDIDGEQLQPIDTLSDEGDVESVLYSRDGQALLYRTIDGVYYVTGAAQTTEPTLLGSYGESGGFDRTNTKLTFSTGKGMAIYDAEAKELRELPHINIGGRITMPTFLHNSDELLYLKDLLHAKEGEPMQVGVTDAAGELEEQGVGLQQPSARFFDDPVISYDDRYVLIEATFEPQGNDDYVGNPQPKDPRLVLYDRFDRKVIDSDTRGIDPVWNR